jgi:hypothetical protein
LAGVRLDLGQAELLQSRAGAEVGDTVELDAVAPQVARHQPVGRDALLGERPVELGPGGAVAVGEIERPDDAGALPAAAGAGGRQPERVAAGGDVAVPDPGDRDPARLARHLS